MDTTRKRGSRPRHNLSFETEMAVLERYIMTDEPLKAIAEAFGVTPTFPYRLLGKYAIEWRRGSTEEFDFLAWREQITPPVKQAPLPDVPAPVRKYAVEASQKWVIEITESFEVESWDIDAALAAAHQLRPGARITSVRVQA